MLLVVKQGQYIFDTFWDKAIPADQRIKEIEEGIEPGIIKNIGDPLKIHYQYINLLKSAKKEIMLIIPTINTLKCQYKIGILQQLKRLVISNSNLCIRIFAPSNKDAEYGDTLKKHFLVIISFSSY
jgi:two-component system sensor histidine kinase VicK